jgi:ATP-dependent DNA helicase Rep
VITCRNDDDEAERVVKDLITHKLMNGKNWKDYAILYRGNFQARVLETQLRQMQIPYNYQVVSRSSLELKLKM